MSLVFVGKGIKEVYIEYSDSSNEKEIQILKTTGKITPYSDSYKERHLYTTYVD